MVGRIPAHRELRVVCGVLVMGMQCEGLDSEYTVMSSVGEVQFGPVQGHFCQMGDQTVQSQTKFLGPGLGPPGTVYISLVLVQTRSRWSSFSFHFIFQVTMHVRGVYLQRHN